MDKLKEEKLREELKLKILSDEIIAEIIETTEASAKFTMTEADIFDHVFNGIKAQLTQDEAEMKDIIGTEHDKLAVHYGVALDLKDKEMKEAVEQAKRETAKEIFDKLEDIFVKDGCHYSKVINLEMYEALKAQYLKEEK